MSAAAARTAKTRTTARTTRYGGLTAQEYEARLDAWGREMLAAFARRTPAERQTRQIMWRAFWDDLCGQSAQRLATQPQRRQKAS